MTEESMTIAAITPDQAAKLFSAASSRRVSAEDVRAIAEEAESQCANGILFTNDFHEEAFAPFAVEFVVENMLPRPEVIRLQELFADRDTLKDQHFEWF